MDTMPGNDPMEKHAPLAGLDPAELLRQGASEDTYIEGASATFNPPPIEELAAVFPQFEILELIGKGGMGAVYKVRQKDLDRIVALKILPPGIGQSPEFSSRFTREARALAKLNHPGIVTLHEFGQQNGLYFILMEFVDGVNLAQLMKTSRISPREALAIVPQICDALQFAHDQGIVHRDIKPENILLDRLGRVKVADFGIAKVVAAVCEHRTEEDENQRRSQTDATLAGRIIGTPQYMAPEQIDHPADVDHRADIYALGVVFYQMLTGELPGKNLQVPSRKVDIDVRLDEIVLRAMEKDPALRYQQASVMRTRVDDLVDVVSDSSSPISDKSSPCLFSAGEYHRGFFGKFIWLYQKRGFLELFNDRLVFSKDDFRQTIPLSALRSVQIGWHSRIAKPSGSKFLDLSYEVNGSTESVHLLPYWSGSNSNPVVTEWCYAICRATRLATGRDFTKELVESEFKPLRSRWMILLAIVPALMVCAMLIGLRECGRVPEPSVREPESNLPVVEKTDIGGPEVGVLAEMWIAEIDGGNYSQSWKNASEGFHNTVSLEEWVTMSKAVRQPLGKVISRKVVSTQQVSALPGMADGPYFVAKFDTSFAQMQAAVETVTFVLEKDGQWKAAAYHILPAEGATKEPALPSETAAVSAAETWLAGIDAGSYSQSWKDAAAFFKKAITEAGWSAAVTGVRQPLGALVSRKLKSAQYTRSLPGAPDGEYVFMQFDTSFAAKIAAVETVTFMKEPDGTWKAAGYLIK
jgi:serine/threonine protein kinase